MKDFIYSIFLTVLLIASISFARHFVNEGYSLLFGVYIAVLGFNIFIELHEDTKTVYEFVSITDNVRG